MTESTIQNTDVQDKGLPTGDLDILETSDALLSKWTDVEKLSEEARQRLRNRFQKKNNEDY